MLLQTTSQKKVTSRETEAMFLQQKYSQQTQIVAVCLTGI